MNRQQAIAYLTQCADDNGTHWHGGHTYSLEDCPTCKGTNDAGWLGVPCSRYGRTSADVAPMAYRHAVIRHGYSPTRDQLSYSMSLVVNDSDEPEQDLRDYAIRLAGADIDAMVEGYLECQLWAQLDMDHDDEGNSPMLDENYDLDDISAEYVESVRDELSDLVVAHPLAIRMYLGRTTVLANMRNRHDEAQFGHDFYLTREHHGTGFWDRGLGELGRYLTDISHWAGSATDLFDNGTGELSA